MSSDAPKTKTKSSGRGCLALLGLPFAAVSIGMGIWLAHSVAKTQDAKRWVETPAQILSAELKTSQGEDSDTYQATARYRYTFKGQPYESDRVSFYAGSDNIGSFQEDAHAELSKHIGREFRCYVNPDHPAEAVLFREMRTGMMWFQLMFVVIFGLAGFGLLAGSVFSRRQAKAQRALEEQYPEAPWKWRPEWASGLIPASRANAIFLAIFAVFWNAIAWPIAALFVPQILGAKQYQGLFILLFPLIGLALAVWAFREIARARRFRGALFRMAQVPGVLGGRLAGLIEIPTKVQAEHGFRLRAVCVRRVTTGSGKNRRTEENILWEDEQLITTDAAREAGRTVLPVLFALPFDQEPSDPDADAPIIWRVMVTASNPGVDLALTFEVPVFLTPESKPDFKLDTAPIKPFLAPANPAEELREAGVEFVETPRGASFVFPNLRYPSQVASFLFIGLIFIGAFVGLLVARVKGVGIPLLFPIIFGAFDVLILWAILDACFGQGRIDVEHGTLRWSRSLLGIGKRGQFAAADIARLITVQKSRTNQTVYYALAVVNAAGKPTVISRQIRGSHAANTLRDQIQYQLNKVR